MTKQQQLPHNPYIIVGKLGSTYGIKGWIKVYSFTEETTTILSFHPWYLEEATGWTKINPEKSRLQGKVIITKLTGFDTPEAARILTGKKIAILKSQLPVLKKDHYYWRDLEGLTVINQKNELLGKITHLVETGSNDVLVIKGEKEKEHAIPYLLGTVVISIDLQKQEMHVNWELI